MTAPSRSGRFLPATLITVTLAATALATLPAIAGHADVVSTIANGSQVPEGSYRFSVALKMTGIPTSTGGKRDSACSGALISTNWIITAGHCFRDADDVRVERPVADLTTATVGRAVLSGTTGEVRTIVAVKQLFNTDIAVARLDRPVAGITPLVLSRTAPAVGLKLRLTGYGSVTGTNPVPSARLLTGQFTVSGVTSTNVGVKGAAPSSTTSACPYDSGAPYFTEGANGVATVVAVESGGPTCPHAQEETTSRIDVAADWISGAIS